MNFILIFISAILMGFALPNEFMYFGSSLIGLIALVPLYLAIIYAKNRAESSKLFGLWVSSVHVIGSFWLAYFKNFAIFTLGLSTLTYFVLGIPFGILLFEITQKKHFRAIGFTIVFTFWEWFKSSGFIAYPWGTILMTTTQFKHLIQIVDITGTWGLSFIMALITSLIGEITIFLTKNTLTLHQIKNKPKHIIRLTISVIFILTFSLSYGVYKIHDKSLPTKTLNIVMVQQNNNSWETENYTDTLDFTIKLTEDLIKNSKNKSDLIIWSEGSLLYSYPLNIDYYSNRPKNKPFIHFLKDIQTPILSGTSYPINDENIFFTNSVCLINSSGKTIDKYSKIQLVPFAEYIPFIQVKLVQKIFEKLTGFSAGYIPGNEYKVMKINNSKGETIKFISPICFEDAFSSLCAHLHNFGSELIINLTNDGWSNTKSSEYQHFIISSFRSIELRSTMIRSTNSGYSCIIDPWGNVLANLPLFYPTGLAYTVPIYKHTKTFYSTYKDWLPAICAVLMILYAFINKHTKKTQVQSNNYIERQK